MVLTKITKTQEQNLQQVPSAFYKHGSEDSKLSLSDGVEV
jgi:hypothetical protein